MFAFTVPSGLDTLWGALAGGMVSISQRRCDGTQSIVKCDSFAGSLGDAPGPKEAPWATLSQGQGGGRPQLSPSPCFGPGLNLHRVLGRAAVSGLSLDRWVTPVDERG